MHDMKKVAILAAASEVFGERGLEGASMRQIAQRAGCTTGAIYPLFASKELIYAELLAASLADLHAQVGTAAETAPEDTRHEAAARAFLDYYLRRPYEVNLGLYAFNGLKKLGVGKDHDAVLNRILLDTVALLSPRTGTRRRGRPDRQAMAMFAQLIGTLVLHQAGRLQLGRRSPHEIIEYSIERQRAAGSRED